jgi:phosphoribosyl-AMP cyclohydrolase
LTKNGGGKQRQSSPPPGLSLFTTEREVFIFCGMGFIDLLKFNADGLIPAIVQDAQNGQVLMMAWMNKESVERTIKEGHTVFWSRSRKEYWVKGQTSGHFQKVVSLSFDCDGDTLLVKVNQTGAACHEYYKSCFFRTVNPDGSWYINSEKLEK